MQSSTGQYSTQAGDPAQPVQHSVMTASSLGFFLRGVAMPFDRGSDLSSSGTRPGALVASGMNALSPVQVCDCAPNSGSECARASTTLHNTLLSCVFLSGVAVTLLAVTIRQSHSESHEPHWRHKQHQHGAAD